MKPATVRVCTRAPVYGGGEGFGYFAHEGASAFTGFGYSLPARGVGLMRLNRKVEVAVETAEGGRAWGHLTAEQALRRSVLSQWARR